MGFVTGAAHFLFICRPLSGNDVELIVTHSLEMSLSTEIAVGRILFFVVPVLNTSNTQFLVWFGWLFRLFGFGFMG